MSAIPLSVKGRRGQAIVELALVLPILLMLVMGVIEFGRAWNLKQVVTDAAREGARRAVVDDSKMTQDSVYASIRLALLRANVPPAVATIQFDQANWRVTGASQTVYVSVPYRFAFYGPLVKAVTGSASIPVATAVTMRNES